MMKYNKAIISLCIGAAAFTACSDAWDEHYNATDASVATESLWDMITSDPELSNFARVLETTHYDRTLNSGQMLTVWAVPISADEANEWIDLYVADSLAGVKREDNGAVVRFVHNHVCLYNHSVSSLTENDTIKMVNGKFMHLYADAIDNEPFIVKNKIATNGVFYKIGHTLPFFNNIYEEMMSNESTKQFADFILKYDEYELDEASSVPGEIVDGNIVYLDSVTFRYNSMLRDYGAQISREDSTYIFCVPTDDVYNTLYERYSKYYIFPPKNVNRDSLQDISAKKAIIGSRVFNINPEVNVEMAKENPLDRDSITCTSYFRSDWENYVFYKPFAADGIFGGKKMIECSNGFLCIDDDVNTFDPRRTFMPDYKMSAQANWIYGNDSEPESTRNDRTNPDREQNLASTIPVMQSDSIEVDGELKRLYMMGDRYMLFNGTLNMTNSTQVSYNLRGIRSNLYYNVYFVFAPSLAENDPYKAQDANLPAKMYGYLHELDADGNMTKGTGKATYINLPETGKRDIITRAGVVDTLCMLKGHQFLYSTLEGDDVCYIHLTSNVMTSENNKTYTRRIRINSIILRGFETEEEAEADYKEYLNARSSNE